MKEIIGYDYEVNTQDFLINALDGVLGDQNEIQEEDDFMDVSMKGDDALLQEKSKLFLLSHRKKSLAKKRVNFMMADLEVIGEEVREVVRDQPIVPAAPSLDSFY